MFAEASTDLVSFYEGKERFLGELRAKFKQNPTILRDKLRSINKLYQANVRKSY